MSQPGHGTEQQRNASPTELTAEELEQEHAAALPEREAMTLRKPGLGLVDLGGSLAPPEMPGLDPSEPQPLPATQTAPAPQPAPTQQAL